MSTKETVWNNKNVVSVLAGGGVAVMPTDTIYGIVGLAENISTVTHIYEIRKRNPDKPCIILIGSIAELQKFSIVLSEEQKDILKELWQDRPTSIILDCPNESLNYLHRGTDTLAFRMPALKDLRELLLKSGPLIAPSANIEGLPPARNMLEAKEYFGDSVDIYVDGGTLLSNPSRVIRLHKDGSINILRK